MQRHLKAIKTNIYKTNRYSNTSIDIYIYMNCNDVDPRPFAMIITLQLPWVGSQNKKKNNSFFKFRNLNLKSQISILSLEI